MRELTSVPAASASEPFALLLDIETRSRRNAMGIPQQVEVRRTWSGIGFRVGAQRLVSAMGEIKEILEFPPLTRVPGALPWVKGIANVRGNLLPIMDLKGFLGDGGMELDRRTRVLVIRHGGLAAGLIVDEVLGMRHFFDEERTDVSGLDGAFAKHLDGAYRQGGTLWGIFSTLSLAKDPRFLHVATQA